MGALDAEAKQYLGKKETFADAFNYLLYDGEQVIKPDQLQEMDTSQIALPYGNEARLPIQKYRDLLKIWEAMTDGKMIYVILGADLYAEDGVLKIKLTSKEFLSGFRKTDKLIPIVSAVIYVGSESWDGPKSLMEMMDIQDKRILPFLNDYKLNIISAADMPEDAFDRFHTDLGITMKIIKHQKYDADKIIEGTNHRKIDPDAAFFLKKAANLDLEFEIEEGGVDMCESLKKKEQRDKITGAIEYMKYDGKSDEDIIAWIIKKYQVTRDYVLALLSPKAV